MHDNPIVDMVRCLEDTIILFMILNGFSADRLDLAQMAMATVHYNLINNFSIIACGARCARSCGTAYLLTGAQHTLRAGIVPVDRELFRQIIAAAGQEKNS